MTRTALLAALAAVALIAACKSQRAAADVDLSMVPCICGTPDEVLDACAHSRCVVGLRNPQNPDCVCGPLTLGVEGGQ